MFFGERVGTNDRPACRAPRVYRGGIQLHAFEKAQRLRGEARYLHGDKTIRLGRPLLGRCDVYRLFEGAGIRTVNSAPVPSPLLRASIVVPRQHKLDSSRRLHVGV